MSSRPRPVTATVTKPRWMQTPSPDTMRKIRRRSVESSGSTASLTSLLDHSSFNSASEDELKTEADVPKMFDLDTKDDVYNKRERNFIDGTYRITSATKSKYIESRLSAWEQWVIEKAKDDQRKKMSEKQKKEEAKIEKEKLEQEKRAKQMKAQVVRQSWVQKKNQETVLKKKLEKEKQNDEQRKKKETEQQIKQKAAEKFAEWQEMKAKEEKEKRKKIKEENQRLQEEEAKRKKMAEQKFQEWLKKVHKRPKSAPNSFGYLSGKMTGYHDRSAYPQPSFFNPIPWQPPPVPTSTSAEKNQKTKVKPYKWNPDKYI
ncbi:coiled-coil domain-containing protein 34 [Biomphalaria glabrata]|nr:coiled-coil domain-containing protein 34-like [Biomphalaria glabrata]